MDTPRNSNKRLIPSSLIGGFIASLSGLILGALMGGWLDSQGYYSHQQTLIENHDRLVSIDIVQSLISLLWSVSFILGGFIAAKRYGQRTYKAAFGSAITFLVWWLPIQLYFLKSGFNITQTVILLTMLPASILGGHVAIKLNQRSHERP